MLWIAISPKGISTPVITSGRGMAVTAEIYVSNCLTRQLIPYLNTHYPQGGYIFWPDKASSHYARITTDDLDANGINYVSKEDNPTEVPQCRPAKDFFGLLSTLVYGTATIDPPTIDPLCNNTGVNCRGVNCRGGQLSGGQLSPTRFFIFKRRSIRNKASGTMLSIDPIKITQNLLQTSKILELELIQINST